VVLFIEKLAMRNFRFAPLFVFGLLSVSTSAQAGAIVVVNNSFEDPVVPYFSTTNGVSGGTPVSSIPGWTMTTTYGNIGVFRPFLSDYTAPDGNQVGYIGGGNPQTPDAGSFSQVLGVSAVAGDLYTLGVYVGARAEGYTVGDYSIELWAGGHLLDSVTDPVAPAAGTFDLTGLTYRADAADTSYGDLEIVLTGGTSDGGKAYGQVAFDDVTLSASAVPEPSTWAMILLGFAGLSYCAARKGERNGETALSVA
jgi:hypothetical protein